ncbi:hypothetical protein M406DRAFT_355950 [Cryphonectria parasitica EP155]|uniref:Uncharacterized protein n=1 Tax=Cryphonectria parasitica (strain ATCC 38755 / EP155) TaxID=660469 RepID=A0A9P4Y2N6_CRYP1|nr:uncharacterized protein M406DRAFT_355950 [Cryphonectria parasitica EP155]KAF3765511.1 hypothetical protein M406DRAFT_355950 [Cryphonectria parasitica EP155]
MVGAYFGKSRLQVGMELEDATYDNWRKWAEGEASKIAAERESAYANFSTEDNKKNLADLGIEEEGEVRA